MSDTLKVSDTCNGRVYNKNVDLNATVAWQYEYYMKDHLGNVRLTFTDKNANGVVDMSNTAANEVLQENHSYPFGLAMNGPWVNDSLRDNQYQFNGKELNNDFGLGWSREIRGTGRATTILP